MSSSIKLSKQAREDVEIIVPQKPTKSKVSAKQKEREKKKLRKLVEKKEKQNKMQSILASLQAHKDDIKDADYGKLRSIAKDLGKTVIQRRKSDEKIQELP
jgi:Spy/CpxP family protein refolding chaperone